MRARPRISSGSCATVRRRSRQGHWPHIAALFMQMTAPPHVPHSWPPTKLLLQVTVQVVVELHCPHVSHVCTCAPAPLTPREKQLPEVGVQTG
jgi:hypothetical protein